MRQREGGVFQAVPAASAKAPRRSVVASVVAGTGEDRGTEDPGGRRREVGFYSEIVVLRCGAQSAGGTGPDLVVKEPTPSGCCADTL